MSAHYQSFLSALIGLTSISSHSESAVMPCFVLGVDRAGKSCEEPLGEGEGASEESRPSVPNEFHRPMLNVEPCPNVASVFSKTVSLNAMLTEGFAALP